MTAAPEMAGPVAQSIRLAFRVLQIATFLLAVGWACSGIRAVPPGSQAVVLRLGQVVRVQQAGLVAALPRPIEQVALVPGGDRQITQRIRAGTAGGTALVDPASRAAQEVAPDTAGAFLTGDGGVVILDSAVTYRIADAAAWYLAQDHIEPALRRVFLASAVAVAAGRGIDDFLVVRGGQPRASSASPIRDALVREVNRRLSALQGPAALGIEATRADVAAMLPPAAKFAFDAVLDATQMAEQGLATARTDAERTAQQAGQSRDRILAEARASADERVGTARAQTAAIAALAEAANPADRAALLDQAWRERIGNIVRDSGSVTAVDLSGGSRVILPAARP